MGIFNKQGNRLYILAVYLYMLLTRKTLVHRTRPTVSDTQCRIKGEVSAKGAAAPGPAIFLWGEMMGKIGGSGKLLRAVA